MYMLLFRILFMISQPTVGGAQGSGGPGNGSSGAGGQILFNLLHVFSPAAEVGGGFISPFIVYYY